MDTLQSSRISQKIAAKAKFTCQPSNKEPANFVYVMRLTESTMPWFPHAAAKDHVPRFISSA